MADLNPRPKQYLGEPDIEYKQRVKHWENREKEIKNREINQRRETREGDARYAHERQEYLTLEKLREANSAPLPAEVIDLIPHKVVLRCLQQKGRTAYPGGIDADRNRVALPIQNFYTECPAGDSDIQIKPDQYFRRTIYLKRIKPEIGQRYNLFYMFATHPTGSTATENWGAILTTSNNNSGDDSKELTGVVETARTAGNGTVLLSVKCDSGEEIRVQVLPNNVPANGTRGKVIFEEDGTPTFIPEDK
jgi:hypothetical protein